jgi:hypothetical protein
MTFRILAVSAKWAGSTFAQSKFSRQRVLAIEPPLGPGTRPVSIIWIALSSKRVKVVAKAEVILHNICYRKQYLGKLPPRQGTPYQLSFIPLGLFRPAPEPMGTQRVEDFSRNTSSTVVGKVEGKAADVRPVIEVTESQATILAASKRLRPVVDSNRGGCFRAAIVLKYGNIGDQDHMSRGRRGNCEPDGQSESGSGREHLYKWY